MPSYIFDILAVLLGTAVTFTAIPYFFSLLGRIFGGNVKSRAQQRRELLLSRAEKEDEEYKQQRKANKSKAVSEDDDWEKVHTDHATTKPSTSAGDVSDYAGIIAFFHPFCNAGGGGERVLFAAIAATQLQYPKALCVVYTGDHDASKEQILVNVSNRFNIHLHAPRVCFLYLSTRDFVLANRYPHFTLLGQSLGSLVLGWDALSLLVPDVFVDTMGYSFVLALAKWLFPTMPTGAYVHYPTISTDMLDSLGSEEKGHGLNAGAGKGAKGWLKKVYWRLFAWLYSRTGGGVDVVMTNSSWTQNHVSQLWNPVRTKRGRKHAISVVYPPCAVEELVAKIPVDAATETERTRDLVYIAQFRPEKMHTLILDAFALFLKTSSHLWESGNRPKPNLILIGSVRDDSDEKRVYKLRLQAQEMKDNVQFVVNAKWPQILAYLRKCSVGVNGMWNEHFGIGVVEYQAAGLISVVNDSGGPKADIVVPVDGEPTGFHASTSEDFAAGFAKALEMSDEEAFAMRLRARKSSWRFSEEVFRNKWLLHLQRLVELVPDSGSSDSTGSKKVQ